MANEKISEEAILELEKSILENEKLSDEQLEEVAGGRQNETNADKAYMCNLKLFNTPFVNDDQLRAMFLQRFQIVADLHSGNSQKRNTYRLNNGAGPELHHGEVWSYIANRVRAGQ